MKLRNYQTRAVASLVGCKRGVLKSPAGSGKTVIGAAALNERMQSDEWFFPSVIWLANTTEQIEQAKKACNNFTDILARSEIRFACYAAGVDCSDADLVICDECHHVAAPTIRKSLENVRGIVWGLSATPERADELAEDVFKIIGPIVCVIERDELIDAGTLSKAKVIFHTPNLPSEFQNEIESKAEPIIRQRKRFWAIPESEIRSRTTWQIAQQIGIYKNTKRNIKVAELANFHSALRSDSVLILVGSIEHGETFQSALPASVMAHSKMGAKKRREAMEAFRARELRCLIATSLADEGLDLPCANVLILAAGGRSAAKAEQRTGRVLRTSEGKTHGLIHDFWDHQHYFLAAPSRARRDTYLRLGYEIEEPKRREEFSFAE